MLPDAGPLFSFAAVPGGLDMLLLADLPITLTDYVFWEATRSGSGSAITIADWVKSRSKVDIIETETGQLRIAAEKAGTAKKRKHVGELTIQEAISEDLVGGLPVLFLFEEKRFVDPGFFGTYPVHSVSTLGLLVGLERAKLIKSADDVFNMMRTNGRNGIQAMILDRPYRRERTEDETTWRPTL